ncbi:phage antirepressor KilAC domain-containing protein [Mucispirillum schaedleri]|uniref:phage antirepressor KilAC domain-containing protein n=1 Tax=Mucispirillum schaedleri TaxID=248039 RepID=UPI001F5697A7|nr:phage antirepressor KilAC domain-containing protein [Mucispirillum schaedleri]
MKELIKIEKQEINNEKVNSVNARDLWIALESKQDFSTWIKARLEQAYAVENEDYGVFHKTVENLKGGRPQVEYALSLDLAKNISMLERNEKGNQIRKYFISCEKQLRQQQSHSLPQTYLEALESLVESEKRNQALQERIEQDKPKVTFANAVSGSDSSISIGQFAKILKQNGIETGRQRLFNYFREKGYLIKGRTKDFNMPTQKAMEQGLFEVQEKAVALKDKTILSLSPRVTTKGQKFFIEHFTNNQGAVVE